MSDWQPIETAPKDGTWVIGRDEDGRETLIQFRSVMPGVLPESWFEGGPKARGNWEEHKCFYPVEWRHAED